MVRIKKGDRQTDLLLVDETNEICLFQCLDCPMDSQQLRIKI